MNEQQNTISPTGLTSKEAKQRLLKFGPNAVEEKRPNQFYLLLKKFWAPIPWLLEITIIFQLILGKIDECIIIAALLIFNSLLSFFQEERANKTLTLLKSHLAIHARVIRDGVWQLIPAQDLVPGDVVHLRMGDISPADVHLNTGSVLLDQSIITGEALPIESEIGMVTYSGTIIKRGEATGEVIATGKATYFGKSVELVQTAAAKSHIKNIIFSIVKYLVAVAIIFAVFVFIFASIDKIPYTELIPFILILLVASIPVALPATFTLAMVYGATRLAKQGVLVTRLSAIEEAATMDVLCIDKTGTITQNQLQVTGLKPFHPYSEVQLLSLAALACDEATQDPIDMAMLSAARTHNLLISPPQLIKFTPFDPAYKRAEAIFKQNGEEFHVLKGAPDIINNLLKVPQDISLEITQFANEGYRVLAVATGKVNAENLELVGLIALQDPPREDSKSLLKSLQEYGLKILMVTGDNLATAKTIAANVGLGQQVCSTHVFQEEKKDKILRCDVFAGMFPEDKFKLVKAVQQAKHICGMTGDGVNDAPALKQAEVGIAVANATDIAKAAASIVLTQAGLQGILAAVEVGRRIYQRMFTYIINKIVKSLEIIIFLSLGVILTGQLIITPLLMVLLIFANDFVTMAIASDHVSFSNKPEHWDMKKIMLAGCIIAALILILSFSIFFFAKDFLHLPLTQLHTLIFVMLVFTGQGNVYLLRERKHFWHSLPGKWLLFASAGDIIIVSILATQGILMATISPVLIVELLIVIIFYLFIIDFLKIRIFSALGWK